ncbi:MAG: class I SAM-dependent RNA methyltransferase [Alphaproteobacteria bacterium]
MTPEAEREVEIATLGAGGDGIAEADGERLYVPLSVPGDRLVVRLEAARGDGRRARIVRRIADGPARRDAPCGHFGDCGGCALQHLSTGVYADWKRGRVVECLAQRGLDPGVVGPPVAAPPGDRRRLRVTAERVGGRLVIGLNARESHRIVAIAECPVAAPPLVQVLPLLRAGLASLWPARAKGTIALTLTETGIDMLLAVPIRLDAPARARLAAIADAADLARLSVAAGEDDAPEPIAVRRTPRITFGDVAVAPPPGSFLQAGAAAEGALVEAVRAAIPDRARIADLFAGCGTFTFPLARHARRLVAVDRDGPAIDALDAAARAAGLGGRLAVQRRDLDRRPLAGAELAAFDVVLLDPPRAGAAAQARALAMAAMATVVYVSCNPATFARDARTLVDGGLALDGVVPVDQFLWSTHVELVAVFRRPA